MEPKREKTQSKGGRLYIVSTPIGNLADITLRAIDTLKQVDIIASEDTRRAKILLNQFKIKKPTLSYHEHNEEEASKKIIALLEQGKDVALISDAGTPLIDDPGYTLVKNAVEKNIEIIPVPGPSALLSALVASGLPCDRILYTGFLPRKKGRKSRLWELREMAQASGNLTLVFYEAPHRIAKLINELIYFFGPQLPAVLAREITKAHQQFLRGNLQELKETLTTHPEQVRGEMVLVLFVSRKATLPDLKRPK